MSRSFFVLAVTLLVVAGSLAFMISFERDSAVSPDSPADHSSTSTNRVSTDSRRKPERSRSSRRNATSLTLPNSATSHLSTAQQASVDALISRAHRESREKLDKLSRQYKLTAAQRSAVFPLVVAHHELAHPAMTINGQSLPAIAPGSTLNDSLASVFDPIQQDELVEASADHYAWWEEVVGQLEVDLDTAIDNEEMVLTDENSFDTGITLSDGPAAGDGEASSHAGGNLFDLLGQ